MVFCKLGPKYWKNKLRAWLHGNGLEVQPGAKFSPRLSKLGWNLQPRANFHVNTPPRAEKEPIVLFQPRLELIPASCNQALKRSVSFIRESPSLSMEINILSSPLEALKKGHYLWKQGTREWAITHHGPVNVTIQVSVWPRICLVTNYPWPRWNNHPKCLLPP